MLRELEYFATLASIHVKDYVYPKKELDDMWENVLLYVSPLLYPYPRRNSESTA